MMRRPILMVAAILMFAWSNQTMAQDLVDIQRIDRLEIWSEMSSNATVSVLLPWFGNHSIEDPDLAEDWDSDETKVPQDGDVLSSHARMAGGEALSGGSNFIARLDDELNPNGVFGYDANLMDWDESWKTGIVRVGSKHNLYAKAFFPYFAGCWVQATTENDSHYRVFGGHIESTYQIKGTISFKAKGKHAETLYAQSPSEDDPILSVNIGSSHLAVYHLGEKEFKIVGEVADDHSFTSAGFVSRGTPVDIVRQGDLDFSIPISEGLDIQIFDNGLIGVQLREDVLTQLGRGGPYSVEDNETPGGEIEDNWTFEGIGEFQVLHFK